MCEMSVTKADFWLGSAASQASNRVPVHHIKYFGGYMTTATVQYSNMCKMVQEFLYILVVSFLYNINPGSWHT